MRNLLVCRTFACFIENEAGVEREAPTRLSPALRKRAHLRNAKQQARNLLSYG